MPYTGTSLYLHFDGLDGQTTTVDSSGNGHVVTRNGNVALDADDYTEGTASTLFPPHNGGQQRWLIPSIELFGFTTFTIQFDVKFRTNNGGENYFYYEDVNAFAFMGLYYTWVNNTFRWRHTNGPVHLSFGPWTPTLNTWYRIRIEWTGTVYTMKVDGVIIGTSQNNSASLPNLTVGMVINDGPSGGGSITRYFDGWIDEYIIYPGILPSLTVDNPVDGSGMCTYVSQGQVRKMVTSITGLDHLDGEEVSVQADGIPEDSNTYEISGGELTPDLPNKAAVVHVGLPYTGKIKLLKASDGNPSGSGQMKMRRIYSFGSRIFRSLGFKIGLDEDNLDPVILESAVLPLLTGDFIKFPKTTWKKDAQLFIIEDLPVPLFIMTIILQSEVENP